MKKRILALVALMLCQMLVVVPTLAAASNPVKEATVLNNLGIINLNLEEDFDADVTITRADFSEMTAKAFNLGLSKNVRYFLDVPQEYWAAGSINALYEAGIISPAENGHFNPDSPITYEQVCKIIVFAAGYNQFAIYQDIGDMSGYVQIAEKMGIHVSVEDRTAIKLREAIEMLYDGMFANVLVPSGKNEIKVDMEKTQFSAYRGVYKKEGVMGAVYGGELEGYKKVSKGSVRIGKEEFGEEKFSADNLFGSYVEYIYEEKPDGTYTLLYAEQSRKADKEFYLPSEWMCDFDGSTNYIKYYKDEFKTKTANQKITPGLQIILNGRPFAGSISQVFSDFIDGNRRGDMKLLDNDTDSGYDIMIINSYETMIASHYDEIEEVLYDSKDVLHQIDLQECDFVSITNEYGNTVAIPDTMPVVLNIAQSEAGDYIHIIVCRTEKTAAIELMRMGEKTITLGGETYPIDRGILDEFSNIKVGTVITAVLDNFGYISHIKQSGGSDKLVYAIKVKTYDEDELDFQLIVYETDKQFHTYSFAERVNIDGKRYRITDYKKLFDAFPEDVEVDDSEGYIKINFKRQPLRINLNNNGEISKIDTYNTGSNESKENTLVRQHDGTTELIYNSHLKRFALDTLYNSSATTLFIVPAVNAEGKVLVNGMVREETPDMYGTSKTFNHDYYYAIESYNYNKENKYTDLIVLKQDPTVEEPTVLMFCEADVALNEEGDPASRIQCYANGAILSLFVDKTAEPKIAELEKGDIIRVVTNASKTAVCDVIKLYDVATRSFNNNGTNANWYGGLGKESSTAWQWNYRNEKYQLSKGRVFEVYNGVLKISYNTVDMAYGIYDEVMDASSMQFVVYDESAPARNRIRGGSINDLLDYKSAGMECSTVLVNLQSGSAKQIFVFK